MTGSVKITAQNVAVDAFYFWREMADCPVNSKVQLLGAGGLPHYGQWDGKAAFYVAWAPLPKRRPNDPTRACQLCGCCSPHAAPGATLTTPQEPTGGAA